MEEEKYSVLILGIVENTTQLLGVQLATMRFFQLQLLLKMFGTIAQVAMEME